MRTSPTSTTHSTTASSWVTTCKLIVVAAFALGAGMLPDLWPMLSTRLSAQAGPPAPVVEDSIYKVESVAYAPRLMLAAAINISPSADGEAVTLPFTIPFYGTRYSNIYIANDGYIAFHPASAPRLTDGLPRPAGRTPQRALLVFHADLIGGARYQTEGNAPNRILTVEWKNVTYSYGTSSPMTFQAQLFENGAPPLLMYANTSLPPTVIAARPQQGNAWVTAGADAGDNPASDPFRINYTEIFSTPYPAAPLGSVLQFNKGFALLETAGPTTMTQLEVVDGTPLVGETATLRATVTAGGLPVTGGGSVTLLTTSGPYATVSVDANGHADFAFPFQIAQPHYLFARFISGNAPHYVESWHSIFVTPVMAQSTAIDFTIDGDPGTFPLGRPSSWVATVTSPGRLITDGSVRFTSDDVVRGTVPVSNGAAVLHATLVDGLHTIKAEYLPVNPLIIPSSITKSIDSGTATVAVEPFVLDNQYLVATVTGASPVTSGTVAFTLNGVAVSEVEVASRNTTSAIAVIPAPPMFYPPASGGVAGYLFVTPGIDMKVGATYSGSPTVPAGQSVNTLVLNRTPNGQSYVPPQVYPSSVAASIALMPSTQHRLGATISGPVSPAGGRVLFFVDDAPVGLVTVTGTTATMDLTLPAGPHVVRAAFLGRKLSNTAYIRPSSHTSTIGAFSKLPTTTAYDLQVGTRLGQPVWTVNATVTTPSNASLTGQVSVNSPSLGLPVTAPVIDGKATITFVTPPAVTNNQVVLDQLTVVYSGTDSYQGSNVTPTVVRGYPTNTNAVAVNPAGGATNPVPDYTNFEATVRMASFANVALPGGSTGSLQVRDGQGGALLSDTMIDWVGQTTERLSISSPVALTMVAYSGHVWKEADGSYTALMPSGAYVQHPSSQSRMTQLASETPYEWIDIPGGVPAFTGAVGVVSGGADGNGRCDDCFVRMQTGPEPGADLPWKIRFLNTDWNEIYLNSNGLISFTRGISVWDGTCPPIPIGVGYGPVLAGFWADHDTRPFVQGGNGPKEGGLTTFQVVGTAPQRVAVFQWDSVNFYPSDSDDPSTPVNVDDQASFQIHLYEDNRAPRVVLRNGPRTKGSASQTYPTIGVDYGDGVRADLLQCSATLAGARVFLNEAYQFQLVLTDTKLTLEPSESPAFAGQPLSITARIDVGGPAANGVSTLVRTSNANPVTLTGSTGASANETIYTDTPPTVGSYTYTLRFNRSAGEPYGNATATLVVPVVPAPQTRTVMTGPMVSPIYGALFQLQSTTTSLATGNPASPNTVRFTSGVTSLGAAATNGNGAASFTATAMAAGVNAYTATYAPGLPAASSTTIGVNVLKRRLQVHPAVQTVAYGAPLHAPSFTFLPVGNDPLTGFALNDSPATIVGLGVATPRTLASPVGSYALTLVAPSQPNYDLLPIEGNVIVIPAGLTVTAPNVSKVFGAPLPSLTNFSYFGFVNNETPAVVTIPPTPATPATQFSAVGSYPILLSGGVAPNYMLGYVAGALNITPAGLTITANNASKLYGGDVPALTATYAGLTANQTAADIDVAPILTTAATRTSNVGSYPITVTGGSDANYTITARVSGVLTVDRAPLHVSANSATMIYGDQPPPFTSTLTGLMNGETEAVLDVPISYNSSVSSISPVGGYPVMPSGAKDANYAITFAPGNISVTARSLTLTVDSKTRPYGQPNPQLTGKLVGVSAQDSITAAYNTSATTSSPVGDYPIMGSLVDGTGRLPNYTPTITAGTLSVTKSPLTITAPSVTRPYGQPNPPMNVSLAGIYPGDGITATVSSMATPTSPVGTYPTKITLHDPLNRLGNYDVTIIDGQLTITTAALSVVADSASRTYGAPNPVFTGTVTGAVPSDNLTVTYSANATPLSAVGSYLILPKIHDPNNVLSNYSLEGRFAWLEITPAPLHVQVHDVSRRYGQANPPLTGTVTGMMNGEVLPITFYTLATPASPVGSYYVSTSHPGGPVMWNYLLIEAIGKLTIEPAPLTVVADDKSRPYGAANPPFTGSVTGLQNGDAITATFFANASPSTPAGTHPIVSTLADPAGKLSNYAVTRTDGILRIDKVPLTIAADDKIKVYGAALPALTATYSGFVNGDTFAVLDTPVSLSTTGTAASGVGSYPITAAGATDHNYAINFVNGALSVSAASLTISADNKAMTYGASLPALTATYSGFVNGDTAASLSTPVSLTTAATSASPAGAYPVVAGGAAGANYDIAYAPGTLTINRAALTITADDASKAYGAPLPSLTASFSGFVNGDTAASLDAPVSLTTTASASSAVGSYPITAAGASDANYDIAFVPGTLGVTRAALTITADDKSKIYGAMVPALTASYGGFVNGDTAASLDTPVTLATTATASSAAGSYPITVGGAIDHNYAIAFVNGSLSVDRAALIVRAQDKSMTYGGAVPAFTAAYDGFVNGDGIASLATPATLTSDATTASAVGDYAITAAGATSPNYAIQFEAGSLTIEKAELNMTANDASRLYGAANPVFTGTLTGVRNGDPISLTFHTVATSASSVGEYPIVPSLVDPSSRLSNYIAQMPINGSLTILRAPIVVTADNKARTYGQANPGLTGTISGVLNGDDITVTYATAATSASAVGGYAITPSLHDPAGKLINYDVSMSGGTLNIGRASLTISADAKSKIYGAALPALTASYDGFVNGDGVASLDTPVSLATTATSASPAGSYPITATGAADHNYDIAFVDAALSINRAGLTITADDKAKTYGATVPALTASYAGFVNGDDASDLVTPVALSTPADQTSPAGAYDIVAAAATSANYDITFVKGTLSVNRAALMITAQNKSKVYGAALPALTVAYAGLVNNDTPADLDTPVAVSTTGTAGSSVGSYPITASGAADTNYDIAFTAGTLDVSRAALTITAVDKAKPYGAAMPSLTAGYAGFVNGDDANSLATPVSLSTIGTAASDVGTYPILASAAASPNYDIAFIAGTLTVNRAALTITADHKAKIYGASMPALTATYSGFVNGDDEWSLATPVALVTTATAASPAGSYAITASGAVDPNYTITHVNGSIDVAKAALIVTAQDASKVYGAALPSFAASYAGFVNGDTAASLDAAVSFTTPATAASNTGTYAIVPGAAADANYAITFANGTLSVTPAALTITADDQSKVYGAMVPALTSSYTGFVNGDGPSSLDVAPALTTTGTASSNAGTYAITASGAADANYTIAYAAGTLTVTKASLTITADSKAKVYGAANPALTASYSGFVNGDSVASLSAPVSLATTANNASVAGTYPITASAAASANYAITFVPGTLMVTKAILTVTANDVTKLLGAPLPAFTVSYTGFLNGDTASSLGGTLGFATAATAASGPGTYTVTPSGATSANYTLQFAPGTMTITYNVCLKSDGTRPAGGTERILLQLCNASGAAAGPSNLTLTAMRVQTPAGAFVANPVGAGQSADGLFKYGSIGHGEQGYIFHIRTQSLPPGSFDLVFSVSGDPQTHTARFAVR